MSQYGPISFGCCPDLIVRTDWGWNTSHDHKHISTCACKAYRENRPCKMRGRCITARETQTWKLINQKSWEPDHE